LFCLTFPGLWMSLALPGWNVASTANLFLWCLEPSAEGVCIGYLVFSITAIFNSVNIITFLEGRLVAQLLCVQDLDCMQSAFKCGPIACGFVILLLWRKVW
jgi:hypothetical protein